MSSIDVNEGVLYEMFIGALCLHPNAPKLFAVDNGDHGLNPLLAKHLIGAVCKWLLESERPKQLLMLHTIPLCSTAFLYRTTGFDCSRLIETIEGQRVYNALLSLITTKRWPKKAGPCLGCGSTS